MTGDGRCVILARHARTNLNADGRLRGHLDPDLDEVGEQEAAALADALASCHPVLVVSSPLRRAVRTAEAIAARAGLVAVTDDRLIDRDYGPWAGQPYENVVAEWGGAENAPGVEAADVVVTRVRAALDDWADDPRLAGTTDATAVLVAHDAVNRLLLASIDTRLADVDAIGQRTACWNVLTRAAEEWRIAAIDEKAS